MNLSQRMCDIEKILEYLIENTKKVIVRFSNIIKSLAIWLVL